MPTFTKMELSYALHELGQLCADAGKVIDIALYGGSCLILVSNFRFSSEDVDAVVLADQAFIYRAKLASAAHEPPEYLGRSRRSPEG